MYQNSADFGTARAQSEFGPDVVGLKHACFGKSGNDVVLKILLFAFQVVEVREITQQ